MRFVRHTNSDLRKTYRLEQNIFFRNKASVNGTWRYIKPLQEGDEAL